MTATLDGIKWNFTHCESCIEGMRTVRVVGHHQRGGEDHPRDVLLWCRECNGTGYTRTKDKSNWSR